MAQEVFEKWGFGLAPAKKPTQIAREKWVEHVLELLERPEAPAALKVDLSALSEVKGLFNRVVRQDQWDWFSVARQLGYPSTRISKVISLTLGNLRTALRDGDAERADKSRSTLRRLPARKCLSVFLSRVEIADEENAGWLYVLSRREEPDLLKIGQTSDTVEARVQDINRATGVAFPFGVRACWRVREPKKAEKIVHEVLEHSRIRGDREFFRIEFSNAKQCIIDELEKHSLEIRTLDNLSALAES